MSEDSRALARPLAELGEQAHVYLEQSKAAASRRRRRAEQGGAT